MNDGSKSFARYRYGFLLILCVCGLGSLVFSRTPLTFYGLSLFLAVLLVMACVTALSLASSWIKRGCIFLPVIFLFMCITYVGRESVLGVSVFQVVSQSMFPTISQNQYILVDKWWRSEMPILRCSIIAFHHENRVHVKRVVALSGDVLSMKNNRLLVNGQPSSCLPREAPTFVLQLPQSIIEEQQLFLLGDNRRRSQDSRLYGAINRSQIVGVVKDIY